MVQAKRGNKVTVISPLLDGDQVFPMPAQRSFFGGNLELLYSSKAASSRLKLGTNSAGLAEQLRPVLERTDIMHIHSFMSPWTDTAARLARRAGVPYVVQDHGKLTPAVLKNRSRAKQLYLWLGGSRVLRNAQCVVPSAEVVAKEIRQWDPKIICRSCTNGKEPGEFEGSPPPRLIAEPYVLFFGWLDPRKNPDLLIRAFASIADRVKPWKLALVGPDGGYGILDSLKQLIAKENMQDRILLPGMARGEARLAWLRNASVFVLPSEGEGLSLAMIEAAACGLPLLLSPGCNYPEAEQHNAGRTLQLTDEAWAAAMLDLLQDDAKRLQMGANARQLFLKLHTLDAVGEQLEQLLRLAASRSLTLATS